MAFRKKLKSQDDDLHPVTLKAKRNLEFKERVEKLRNGLPPAVDDDLSLNGFWQSGKTEIDSYIKRMSHGFDVAPHAHLGATLEREKQEILSGFFPFNSDVRSDLCDVLPTHEVEYVERTFSQIKGRRLDNLFDFSAAHSNLNIAGVTPKDAFFLMNRVVRAYSYSAGSDIEAILSGLAICESNYRQNFFFSDKFGGLSLEPPTSAPADFVSRSLVTKRNWGKSLLEKHRLENILSENGLYAVEALMASSTDLYIHEAIALEADISKLRNRYGSKSPTRAALWLSMLDDWGLIIEELNHSRGKKDAVSVLKQVIERVTLDPLCNLGQTCGSWPSESHKSALLDYFESEVFDNLNAIKDNATTIVEAKFLQNDFSEFETFDSFVLALSNSLYKGSCDFVPMRLDSRVKPKGRAISQLDKRYKLNVTCESCGESNPLIISYNPNNHEVDYACKKALGGCGDSSKVIATVSSIENEFITHGMPESDLDVLILDSIGLMRPTSDTERSPVQSELSMLLYAMSFDKYARSVHFVQNESLEDVFWKNQVKDLRERVTSCVNSCDYTMLDHTIYEVTSAQGLPSFSYDEFSLSLSFLESTGLIERTTLSEMREALNDFYQNNLISKRAYDDVTNEERSGGPILYRYTDRFRGYVDKANELCGVIAEMRQKIGRLDSFMLNCGKYDCGIEELAKKRLNRLKKSVLAEK